MIRMLIIRFLDRRKISPPFFLQARPMYQIGENGQAKLMSESGNALRVTSTSYATV